MLISTQHLPRDLRIVGVLAFLFAFLQIGEIFRQPINFIVYLSPGIIYFSLAAGVSKKEKWAWFAGVTTFIVSIIYGVISLLFGWISLIYLIISLLIPGLFLITFFQSKKEITISSEPSLTPLVIWVISFLLNIAANGYFLYLVYSLG